MSKEQALARFFDTPSLARIVPHLPAETLHQLIQHRGLDACGDLVTAATPAQLTSLLDLDLWARPQRGRDEQFDVDRFGEWIEMLVDIGESVAARTVAALDPQLVILGLSRYLRIFDPGTFEPIAQSDDESIERHDLMNSETARNVPECEIGGYIVRARRTDTWDAITILLAALETEQARYFHDVMQGCRVLSNSTPEDDGLDDLLLAPEQHLHDVAIEREQRRSQQGFATAADARAFLEMARQPRETLSGTAAANPIAAAYFRAAQEEQEQDASATRADAEAVPASFDAAIELLVEAGMVPDRPRALLEAAAQDSRAPRLERLRTQLAFVQQHDEVAYLTRSHELAFLANTLLAGCSIQSRPFTPQEASDAAACACNLGLERRPGGLTDGFLVDHDLVMAFESGWSELHREVTLFAADALLSTLGDLHCRDLDTRRELHALHRKLTQYRETPWLARTALEVLAIFDPTAWISVAGLLDECPILPAALTAVLVGQTTPVSPNAFEFISTTDQIGDVRVFMNTIANVLSR